MKLLFEPTSPSLDLSVSGNYLTQRQYLHKGHPIGDFTSASQFYVSDHTQTRLLGEQTFNYTAPWTYVHEPRLGLIPASELQLRRHQLNTCLTLSETLRNRGIKTTITQKSIEEITSILNEWEHLLEGF